MDKLVKWILSAMTPILALIAIDSHHSLLGALLLFNPFTMITMIAFFDYLISSRQAALNKAKQICATKERTRQVNDKNLLEPDEDCCSAETDSIYMHYNCWLRSTHLTLFLVFQFVVASLELSIFELSITHILCIALAFMILDLKQYTIGMISASNNTSTTALLLGKDNNFNKSPYNYQMPTKCELQFCHLKMLAHPTLLYRSNQNYSRDIRNLGAKNASLVAECMDDGSIGPQTGAAHKQREFSMTKSTSRTIILLEDLIHLVSGTFKQSIGTKGYLVTCNIFHLALLASYAYFNLTFSCACNLSRFGKAIIIPVDCSDVYNNRLARVTMFCGVYAGQLFLCHLVFLFKSIYG